MTNAADLAVSFCRAQIGKPYELGATGPNAFDCSGLLYAAYQSAGHPISRVTYTQINDGSEVTESQLMPGDLVFPSIEHVGIYSGNGMIISAPHTGSFVGEKTISAFGGFWRARRIVPGGGTATGGGSDTGVSVVSLVSNPLDAAGQVISAGANLFKAVLSPYTWERVGLIVGGVVIGGVGAFMLAKEF